MNRRIKELVDWTKDKFGLKNYYLQTHQLDRNINILNETIYTLSMEWFPNHTTVQEDDGSNPEGTASIEINVNSRKFERVIFVKGKSYAEGGIMLTSFHREDIIKWIENETGLTYGKQFQIHKEEEREFLFKECINGISVSPSGFIEVKFDQEGKLTYFSVSGQFPSKELVKEETYTLSLEKLEHLTKEQLKLIEYPSFERKKIFPVYGVEEIYVTNNEMVTIPFEIFVDMRLHLQIDQTIYWDKPLDQSFERKELDWSEDISVEQAFSFEPSPDAIPISKVEKEKCINIVKELLRQEYPKDSGKWNLKTLHCDKGYINAILRLTTENSYLFQRKLVIMIERKSLQAVNYIDNKPMLEIFDQFQPPEKVTVTKEEAFDKLKECLELHPYYVYDFKQKQYVLCGKLDCDYGMNASNGEVIVLNEL